MKKPAAPTRSSSVVSELEGVLLNESDHFSYFMLVAFEASGLIRFTVLLLLWPIIRLLYAWGMRDAGLKLMIFVATVGLRASDIESTARAVLPKFYYDDVNMEAWKVFSGYKKRVVVTKMPRVMVERFVKEHLGAYEVIGSELVVSTKYGLVTGFVEDHRFEIFAKDCVARLFGEEKPSLGMASSRTYTSTASYGSSFLSLCKEVVCHPIFSTNDKNDQYSDHQQLLTTKVDRRPLPVIFHDGRLVKRPTPLTSLVILLWLPLGIIMAILRILIGLVTPIWATPYITSIFGGQVVVKGKPPPTTTTSGVLFVCTHRTLMDPIILSHVLNRKIPAVTYSISRLSELLSPIPTIRLTRNRQLDADRIKSELRRGDLVLCPEGTTCREPFLLRFSALFAELTDQIVPVAMNYKGVGFFHATTARGWKGLDPFFFFMNPRPVYEVTFLNQLPAEATCSSGKSPHDVANYVQRLLAATLGFECTNLTRKDKYRLLAGNDGSVKTSSGGGLGGRSLMNCGKKVVGAFKPFIH